MMSLVVMIAAIPIATGFLFGTDHADCPAPPPCTCSVLYISCNSSRLNAIPDFKDTGDKMQWNWGLTLSFNNISTMPNNSFITLVNISNGHTVALDLRNNQLTSEGIESGAFNGIAEYVHILNMDNNNLTSLPAAIGKLTRVTTLRVLNNPLANMDGAVVKPIGSTLRYLYISLQYAHVWPESLHYLKRLDHLEVYNINQVIPNDAFTGFSYRLGDLELHNATFGVIPPAVCTASKLVYLQIEGDAAFTGDVNGTCNSPFHWVSTLHYINDGILTFPAIFELFPNVTHLKIHNSDISYIDESLIPINNSIVDIIISNSKLIEIPRAFRLFHSIREIALEGNLISNLGYHSVENFLHLSSLFLTDNPILSIAKDAFWNVPALRSIDLSGTKLATIPQAVESLPRLSELYMERNAIPCECSLQWTEDWLSRQHVRITGTCASSTETITHYITNVLHLYHCI